MANITDLGRRERSWEELYMTASLVRKAWETELASSGLTVPQALVLYFLVKSPAAPTLQELAQMMCREPHGISALISRMQADGLVSKKRRQKSSQIALSLTEKGRECIQAQLALRVSKDVTRTLSDEELDMLHLICDKMRAEALRLIQDMRSTPYDAPLE